MAFALRISTAAVGGALFFLTLLVGGCDAVNDDVRTFDQEVEFSFDFSTEGSDAGDEIVVHSEEEIDFDEFLIDEGYTKDDLIVANIQSVVVEQVAPAGVSLSAFDRVAFTLEAEELDVPILAESDDLPDDQEESLDVLYPGISEVLWQPIFAGRLIVVPATGEGEQYEMTVTMNVNVQAPR